MTFTLPQQLAEQLVRKVPAHQRSRYVAEAVADKLATRSRNLIRACEVANENAEVRAIEEEFDAIAARITEPWSGSPTRRRVVGRARSNARVRN
jgi:hypothetical protein